MNPSSNPDLTPDFHPRSSAYPPRHSPYPYPSKMTQRRAIACTICAKAKTKCDKAVPTCSRCAAKGLPCEPRSTRRTSDSAYRQVKKRVVSPKRFHSTNSIPGLRRDESPRSIPGFDPRHPLSRHHSQMDLSAAAKMSSRPPQLTGMPMLTPLQTFNPQITDVYSDYSPDSGLMGFPHQPSKESLYGSGRLTPQTPDSFTYSEPLPIVADPFDQYVTSSFHEDHHHAPIGLGFERDMPGMFPNEPEMRQIWSTPDLDGNSTPIQHMRTFESPMSESPVSFNAWGNPSLSMSPQPPHTRAVPSLSMSDCSVVDFDPTLQDEWPSFRCNPNEMSLGKPCGSSTYLEGLKSISRSPNVWEDSIVPRLPFDSDPTLNKYLNIQQLGEFSRDAVMDVVNSLVTRARRSPETIRLSSPMLSESNHFASEADEVHFASPSPPVLESLFKRYGARFEAYYPGFAARKLDVTELLHSDASRLYLLLIVAAGASATPTKEAQSLTYGLIEASRIVLGEMTDNDISLWNDPMVLRTALLSINLAAWSGEKWHMDVAKTQSDLYFTVLRSSGLFAYRENYLPEFDGLVGTEISWKKWKQHESLNRLVHSWIIVDQELALFHDKAPNFCTTELTAALPDREVLWRATSADSWASVYAAANANKTGAPPSLYDMFQRLKNRQLVNDAQGPTRMQLRLLLHPIQALVHHLHQCIGCFAGDPNNAQAQGLVSQMREVQVVLGDWYNLCRRRMQMEAQPCPILLSNLIMYHLICLNTMTDFSEIERFARGETSQEQFIATSWTRTKLLGSAHRIWFHCGQVMRLVRSIPEMHRPLWMPAAIYRVCLLLWSTGMANPPHTMNNFNDSAFPIDDTMPDSPQLLQFLQKQQGTPMLSLRRNQFFSLSSSPAETIAYCLEVMKEEDLNTGFAQGIRNRLDILNHRVKVLSPIL